MAQPPVFVLDVGKCGSSLDAFYDEVQRVLCPGFAGFGRNLDAFNDVLRGGFGAFALGAPIAVVLVGSAKAKKRLPRFAVVVDILQSSSNVTLTLQ